MDAVLELVHEVAEAQHSVVSSDQLNACGASGSWITRALRYGVIVRDGPAVYRMGGVPRTFKTRAMAAVLSARGPALVSHRSAAFLHGIEPVLEPVTLEITVPRHRRPRRRAGIRVHESLAFDMAEAATREGIPVTGVARTILDCARMFERPIRLLDDALRQRMVTWEELWRCYLAHNAAGRNVRPFRQILLQRDGHAPPVGEFAARMAEMLTGAGLPQPVFEHRVVVDGHVYSLDVAWPERMVAIECNDAGSHDTPKAFRRDPMKRNRCERVGWRYLEFTWWEMIDNAAEVVGLAASALERAAAA